MPGPSATEPQARWSEWLHGDNTHQTAPCPYDDPAPDNTRTKNDLFLWKPLSPIEENFRHSWWSSRRRRTMAALDRADVPAARRFNFAHCGCNTYIEVNQETGQVRARCIKCHDRFCQACGQERASVLGHALRERVNRSKTLHVVLTLKSRPGPLKPQLDRLYRSASKLRANKWWKLHVTGGSQTLELTRNADNGQWHPHLHLLVHADYLDHRKLSELWLKVTGDSFVVHVSLVRRDDAAVREVTKYLSKPIHRSVDFCDEALDELIPALKGRRMITTFGTWRKDPLLSDRDQTNDDQWKIWGTFAELARKAAANDAWARATLHYLTSLRPGRLHRDPPPKQITTDITTAHPPHAP